MNEQPTERKYAHWVIASAISALMALPATPAVAQAETRELIEHSISLIERHHTRVDTSALEAAVSRVRGGGGKNGKHANVRRKIIAAVRQSIARAELDRLKALPRKSKQDKHALRKAQRRVKHYKRTAEFGGDHDSQTPKGAGRTHSGRRR